LQILANSYETDFDVLCAIVPEPSHPERNPAREEFVIATGIRRTPPPTGSPPMFNTLLVPLDGSPQSVLVVDLASRVAIPGTATIHLLCVVDPSYALHPASTGGVAYDGLVYPYAHAQTSFALSVLAAATVQLADRNLTVEQHFCAGDPADVVIEQARLLTAEVIVMGHRRLSRVRRWANPSTCVKVIEKSPCSVLVESREED
jgi:nucleotide-binding universal stress UspA family protein